MSLCSGFQDSGFFNTAVERWGGVCISAVHQVIRVARLMVSFVLLLPRYLI